MSEQLIAELSRELVRVYEELWQARSMADAEQMNAIRANRELATRNQELKRLQERVEQLGDQLARVVVDAAEILDRSLAHQREEIARFIEEEYASPHAAEDIRRQGEVAGED